MEVVFLIGRIIVGLYYLYNGINHFWSREGIVGYGKSQGLPMADLSVPVSGVMLIAGGLSILLGAYPLVGIALVFLFLVPTAFIMHRFWGVDPQMSAMQRVQFLKNIALAGSALMFVEIPRPWIWGLGLG